MRQAYWIKSVNEVFESLNHGETLTKFIACDKGDNAGDFTVTIHGFVTSRGQLIVTHEISEDIKG